MSYVDISGVDLHRGIVSSVEMTFEDAPSRARRIVRDGDTIVSTVRTYLGAITPIRDPVSNTIVSTGFAVIRPREIFSDFMSYLLRESGLVGEIVSRSLGVSYPAVNASEIGTLPILLPDLDEQRDITAFLDRETMKIDMLVEKQEQLVDLFQERRAALISHAVTKGLDPNIPMKDSGIEWLGEIPEHWGVKKLKRIFHVVSGATPKSEVEEYWGGGVVWITPEDLGKMTERVIRKSERDITVEGLKHCGATLIPEGSLVLSTRAPIGHLAIAGLELCTNQGCRGLVFRGESPQIYSFYFLCVAKEELKSLGQGSTFSELPKEKLETLPFVEPPTQEQQAIATYLDREMTKIDSLITKVHQAIKLQKELRSALISAAVTGKIDVRQASVPTA